MTGEIYLTAHNRQGEKKYRTNSENDLIAVPRLKFIHNDGTVKYLSLAENTTEDNPKFSIIINGVRYYITDSKWFVDFLFPRALQSLVNLKPNGYEVSDIDVIKTGNLTISSYKWTGSVLAPNGKVYGIPHRSPSVIEIDTETNATRYFGTITPSISLNWGGGVLAPNGKIYGVSCEGQKALEIDLENESISLIPASGCNGSYGGTLAPNGKIYSVGDGVPVRVFDPSDFSVSVFGTGTAVGSDYYGSVLGANEKIYGMPRNARNVVEIDSETSSVFRFGNLPSGGGKFRGGVLAPNGKIYGIPQNSTSILEVDTDTKTVNTFGNINAGEGSLCGGVLAPNGKIYGIPNYRSKILEIDPITKTIVTFGDVGTISEQFFGGVLAPNGKIFSAPHKGTQLLTIQTGDVKNNGLLSPYFNKL